MITTRILVPYNPLQLLQAEVEVVMGIPEGRTSLMASSVDEADGSCGGTVDSGPYENAGREQVAREFTTMFNEMVPLIYIYIYIHMVCVCVCVYVFY